MASSNASRRPLPDLPLDEIRRLYVDERKSLKEVAPLVGASISTVRDRLIAMGCLRSMAEALTVAKPKLGSGLRGKRRPPRSTVWCEAIRRGKLAAPGKGVSLKPTGYIEFTRGPNKGRAVHRVVMEQAIGRSLQSHESVHHIDHNRANNDISNLQLMTRAEHARLHAFENLSKRKRKNGRFC